MSDQLAKYELHICNDTVFDRMRAQDAHLILGLRGEALFREGALIKYFSKNVVKIYFGKNKLVYLKSIYKISKEIMNNFISEFFFNNNLKT